MEQAWNGGCLTPSCYRVFGSPTWTCSEPCPAHVLSLLPKFINLCFRIPLQTKRTCVLVLIEIPRPSQIWRPLTSPELYISDVLHCEPPLQTAPAPRHGHTAVWDGADRLLIFGGSCGGSDVHVLTLRPVLRWSVVTCQGQAPEPRSGHVAVMLRNPAHTGDSPAPDSGSHGCGTDTWLSPTRMLVFGGISPQVSMRAPRCCARTHIP